MIIQGGGTPKREESSRNLSYDVNNLNSYKMVNQNDFIVHLRSFEGGLEIATNTGIISPAYHTFHGENTDSRFYYAYFRSKKFIHKDLKPHVYGIRDGRSIDIIGMKTIKIPFTSFNEQKKIGDTLEQLENLITLHQCEYFLYFENLTDSWEQREFKNLFIEKREKTTIENEDTLLSCAITGMYLNSELFGAFRGSSTIGYLKIKKNDLILSAQNLHLGNANVNLRFEKGIISPAYKVFTLNECNPYFVQSWVKKEDTKNFFLAATTEGASQCRKNIEWQTLFNQKIATPKLTEQIRIGNYFNKLDEIITLHRRE